MSVVGCYDIEELIPESKSSAVYRATVKGSDEDKVLVKVLPRGSSLLFGIQRIQKEYSICCTLSAKSNYFLPPIDFISEQGTVGIVWKDTNLVSLKRYLRSAPSTGLNIHQFLRIAKQLAEALHIVHSNGIIHRDISDGNILLDPKTQQAYICDFGSSTYWREKEENTLPAKTGYPVCGTYQYMSPEHTGKIDVGIDFRSDIYSLGIVFYQILTGSTPLKGICSRLGILFAHVAVDFPPIHLLTSCYDQVPLVLSNIVSKMLRKDINERYQSCFGLLQDLNAAENYLDIFTTSQNFVVPLSSQFQEEKNSLAQSESLEDQLLQLQSIQNVQRAKEKHLYKWLDSPMKLGTKDRTPVLVSPKTIYGRELQLERIIDIFSASVFQEKICNSGVIIVGYSGTGKSALYVIYHQISETVHSGASTKFPVRVTINATKGKFPQYSIFPFQCLVGVFSQLFQELVNMKNRKEILCSMRTRMGTDLSVLAEQILPEIRQYYPDLEPPPKLTTLESVTTLQKVICNWISFVSEIIRSVIIFFIDDLQWGDENSLTIFNSILSLRLRIFFFFAVRGNEIKSSPFVSNIVSSLSKDNPLREIHLEPLDIDSVSNIIADMMGLSSTKEQIHDLATLIAEKTLGNPFFITQFVEKLYDEELLKFNLMTQEWEYNIEEIRPLRFTDNVVQLLIEQIHKLPIAVRKILEIASCLGLQFYVDELCELNEIINNETTTEVLGRLTEVMQKGFIQPCFSPISKDKREQLEEADFETIESDSGSYQLYSSQLTFLHDRVQEGFYISIPKSERNMLHYRIGCYLKNKLTKGNNDKLIDVVYHLHQGCSYISSLDEAKETVQIFIRASQLARKSGTLQQALQYALRGRKIFLRFLTEEECWKQEYAAFKEIYWLICEVRAVCSKDDRVEMDFKSVKQFVTNRFDRLEFCRIFINYLNNQQQFDRSLQAGLDIMKEFGYPIQENTTRDDFERNLKSFQKILGGEPIHVFLALPLSSDAFLSQFLEFVILIAPSAYLQGNFPLYCSLILLCVTLTKENGLFESSGVTLSALAFCVQALIGPSDQVCLYAQAGLEISKKIQSKPGNMCQCLMYNGILSPFWTDLENSTDILTQGIYYSLQCYDYGTCGYCLQSLAMIQCFHGMDIPMLLDTVKESMNKVASTFKTIRSDILVLIWGVYSAHYRLVEGQDPEPLYSITQQTIDSAPEFNRYGYYLFHMISHYIMHEEKAILMERNLQKLLPFVPGIISSYEFYFYSPLIQIRAATSPKKLQAVKIYVKECIDKYKELCNVSSVFQSRLLILQAEARLLEKPHSFKVMNFYNQALCLATERSAFQIAAIAAERCFDFLSENCQTLAQHECLNTANEMYYKWGAIQKCVQLTGKLPGRRRSETSAHLVSEELSLHNLVLSHVTQILTKNANTVEANAVFTKVIQEHARADKGFILFQHQSELYVIAKWDAHGAVHYPIPDKHESGYPASNLSSSLPLDLIAEVFRDGSSRTGTDVQHYAASLCCIPMKSNASTKGVIVLENTIRKGAFSLQHQIMLEHLACQIISIMERNELDKHLKKTLKKAQKRARLLESVGKMKDDFVASTSHELRTPLNAVLGYSEILTDTKLNDEQREYCDMINASAEGLLAVINDILDFQGCQSGTLEVNRELFDLRESVDRVVRLIVAQCVDIELVLDLDDDIDDNSSIECDRFRLQQIFLNLLSNAVKFTRTGSVTLSIKLENDPSIKHRFVEAHARRVKKLETRMSDRLSVNEETGVGTQEEHLSERDANDGKLAVLLIQVTDTGIGIDPEKRKDLFKPFSQLDSGPTRKYAGTGLGLVISQNLVQLLSHGDSKIEFESETGKGSSFWFRVPAKMFTTANKKRQSLETLRGSIFIIHIPSTATRKFFMHEIRSVDLFLKRFTSTIEKTVGMIQKLRNKYPKKLIYCFIDSTSEDNEEERLVSVLHAVKLHSAYLMLITQVNKRNNYSLSFSKAAAKGLHFINKPFYKNSVINSCSSVVPVQQILAESPRGVPENSDPASVSHHPKLPEVLMVEDNKMNQRVQLRMLKLIHLECDVAANGKIGVEMFENRYSMGTPYRVILMDFHMPEMDGKEATRFRFPHAPLKESKTNR